MRKLMVATLLGLMIAGLMAVPIPIASTAYADSWVVNPGDQTVEPVSGALGAISTDTVLLIKHVGTAEESGTVTVASNGDITLKVGVTSSEAADASVKCPSGGSAGIIDVSDTACDTLGEVVDVINASSKWKAVILDGLRSDSSNDTLATLSETAANTVNGLGLLHDDTVDFIQSIALTPERTLEAFLEGPNGNRKLVANPYIGWRTKFQLGTFTSTYGSGSSALEVHSVAVHYDPSSGKGTETDTTLYSVAGGNTTVAKTLDFTSGNGGILGKKGEKVLVRIKNTAAMTAATSYAYGVSFRYK